MTAPAFRGWRGVTAVTPLRPGSWRWLWLHGIFAFGRTTQVAIRPLLDMRVIALARFTLWPSPWAPRYLIFESNWTGSPQNYIPDLGRAMPAQWLNIWGVTERFPGPLPTDGLLDWVGTIDQGQGHLWTDYDQGATAEQIARSLQLRETVRELLRGAADRTPDQVAGRLADLLDQIETRL